MYQLFQSSTVFGHSLITATIKVTYFSWLLKFNCFLNLKGVKDFCTRIKITLRFSVTEW